MKGFDAKFIEELKSKSDIVETVSRYVPLELKGGSYWGRCPFHHEKTPSFCVNQREQFYYCFGCHQSGDVIKFIMEIESLDFSDAVKLLAERAKIPLPEIRIDDEKIKEEKRKKERLLSLLKDTALFYVKNLKTEKAQKHVEYILKRNFTSETVVKFGMGASLDFNGLPEFLKSKGYTYEEMVNSGAVGTKNGRYFDFLGGRLIIPVIDQFKNVVAFDGRRIDDIKEQKYINTRETQVFSKGKTLFNLNNLKQAKNEVGIDGVIIVEGHLDVVTLTQAGFNNVVASMGTSLTKDQARIIKRYSDKVFISYDGDFAGQKASIRGLEILKEEGLDVKVVSLPDGFDPDDVIKKLGKEEYKKLLDNAMPLIDFKLEILKKTFDLKTVDGKRKFIVNAIKVIRESPSPSEQEDLLKTVRDLTGTTFETLKRELYTNTPEEDIKVQYAPEFTDNSGDKSVLAGRYILSSYLFNKPFALEQNIDELEFSLPVHKEIQQYISDKLKEKGQVSFSDIYESVSSEDGELSRIAGLESDLNKRFDEAVYFNDCIRILKVGVLDRKINKLNSIFNSETDTEKRRELAKEISVLLKTKNKLS